MPADIEHTKLAPRIPDLLPLALILCVAAALRIWRIDHWSFWYDEVVTMRLARTGSVSQMIALLGEIDATRAPLHPLLLMGWIRIFGTSEFAARALSALFGIGTVAAVYGLVRAAFDHRTANIAAWLTAVCPTLVYYSQEVRMYALLVLLTVLSWWCFLRLRQRSSWPWVVAYAISLGALFYTHPVSVFMIVAQLCSALPLLIKRVLPMQRWFAAMSLAFVFCAPWCRRYLDHPPDYPMPHQPLRYLLGVPIEYVGGTAITLVPLGLIALHGMSEFRNRRLHLRTPAQTWTLLCWFLIPIIGLYTYSWIGHSIFGPARYHLFVAPAYLILLARGLAVLPRAARWPVLVLMAALSAHALSRVTYAPGVKADWRGVALWLAAQGRPAIVVVNTHGMSLPRTQYAPARFYLEPANRVVLESEALAASTAGGRRSIYQVHCIGGVSPSTTIGGRKVGPDLYGLIITLE